MRVTIPWPLPAFTDLDDAALEALRGETKRVVRKGRRKDVEAHTQKSWELESTEQPERTYRLFTRQAKAGSHIFSCGLVLVLPGRSLTLCRYNGPYHRHRNPLAPRARCSSEVAHRHLAIASYLTAGLPGDRYAMTDGRFTSLDGALHYATQDCGIIGIDTEPEQTSLWERMQPSDGRQ